MWTLACIKKNDSTCMWTLACITKKPFRLHFRSLHYVPSVPSTWYAGANGGTAHVGMSRQYQWRYSLYPCPASPNGVTCSSLSLLLSLSRHSYWRFKLSHTPSRCCQWRHPCSRHCQWRYKLHANNNGGTHLNNRPPLQFVLKQTPFDKLFLKQVLYSKFASIYPYSTIKTWTTSSTSTIN